MISSGPARTAAVPTGTRRRDGRGSDRAVDVYVPAALPRTLLQDREAAGRRSRTRTSRRSGRVAQRCLLRTLRRACGRSFGDDVLAFEEQRGHAVATVTLSKYRDVCGSSATSRSARLRADFTAGVDFGPDRGFEVVSHLLRVPSTQRPREGAAPRGGSSACPTISDLWPRQTGTSARRWRCSGSASKDTRSR